MSNPYSGRSLELSGPFRDISPVTPDDNTDLAQIGIGLYFEQGGSVTFDTVSGARRTVAVADYSVLAVGVTRVLATGTTANGIHIFTA